MSAAVKLSAEPSLAALLLSVGLHAAFLLLPLVGGLRDAPAPKPVVLPSSVAMQGNSIEVEAPTPELAGTPERSAATPEPAAATPELAARPEPAAATPELAARPEPAVAEPHRAPKPAARPRPAERARPAMRSTPRPAAATPASGAEAPASGAEAPASGAEAPTSGAPAAGTFGQEGLAPGVRRLGYAFTRAIPAASPADSAWRDLPAGHVGTIRIELAVDESNRLGALKRWQARPGEPAPPAALERMVERTLILLRAGQFALSGSNQPGSERLVIDVWLRDEAAEDDAVTDVVQKKFDGASPGHPGKAYFRYGTGRAFEAKVTVASSGR